MKNAEFLEVTSICDFLGIDPVKFALEGAGKKKLSGLMVESHNMNVESFVKIKKVDGKFHTKYCLELGFFLLDSIGPDLRNILHDNLMAGNIRPLEN